MRNTLIFLLMGATPALALGMALLRSDVQANDELTVLVGIALAGLLAGLLLLLNGQRHLKRLARNAACTVAGRRDQVAPLTGGAAKPLREIDRDIRALAAESDKHKRNFTELANRVRQHTTKIKAMQKKLEQESALRNYLARYVGNDVIEQIILSQKADPLKNERCEATLLFADIRSFTTLSENMSPEEIIAMLNEYFDVMVAIIFKHGGILDKFIGDELMAVFPSRHEDNAIAPLAAVRAAQDMQEKIGALMQERNARGRPVFQVGIGVNTGRVVVGNVGARNRMDYTVIGDTVNVAARLEQMADGGEILVGEQTHARCKHAVLMRKKGEIKVRNRDEPVGCFEVVKQSSLA